MSKRRIHKTSTNWAKKISFSHARPKQPENTQSPSPFLSPSTYIRLPSTSPLLPLVQIKSNTSDTHPTPTTHRRNQNSPTSYTISRARTVKKNHQPRRSSPSSLSYIITSSIPHRNRRIPTLAFCDLSTPRIPSQTPHLSSTTFLPKFKKSHCEAGEDRQTTGEIRRGDMFRNNGKISR